MRPRPGVEPVVRFETPPGHQAQVDYAHFKLPWGQRWALLFSVSYSDGGAGSPKGSLLLAPAL